MDRQQTMTQQISRHDPRLSTWAAFLRAHARVVRELERELQAEQRMALTDYDVLVQLAAAEDRRLRMSELAERLLLSRSGVTRLVDRLVAQGLVEREICDTDRRGQWAALTDAGLALLHELPVFESWQGGDLQLGLLGPKVVPNHLSLRGSFTDSGMRSMRGLDGLFSLDIDDSKPLLD